MTITLDYRDDAELARKCLSILESLIANTIARQPQPPRSTVGELARRVGRNCVNVCISLKRKSCPPFVCARGKTGRILWLEPTPELLRYLQPQPQKARA